ncbi:MAG: PDZ domain-containing protein [Actinobacteria bacterium]|nr:PDZ domain-containing protein [Actinomycetota bacterium]
MSGYQRFIVFAVVVIVGTLAFVGGYWARGSYVGLDGDAAGDLAVIEDAYREIVENADDPPDTEKLADGAIKGMVGELRKQNDPHALFYTPDDYLSFQELTSGEFTGIGIWIKRKAGSLHIVSVLPDTPAKAAGLHAGDVLVAVDGRDLADLTTDEAVDAIKGKAGTDVQLTVSRRERELEFDITRARLELPNLQARTERGFGYIQLFGFAHGAGDQVRTEVRNFVREDVAGVVLDLRDNGGGLLTEAIEVAGVFIEDGKIATFRQRTGPDRVYRAEGDAYEDVPLVVLVNEGTASASEIVAGALRDLDRARLVGTRTYGKGSVQQVMTLADSSAIKLTIGSYHTPDGHDLDGKGLAPDVAVVQRRAQLGRALEMLEASTGAAG